MTTTLGRARYYLTTEINKWYTKHSAISGITGHVDSIYTTGLDSQHLTIEYSELHDGDLYDITSVCEIPYYSSYTLPQLYHYWRQEAIS